ncbi:hypothetical protein ZIOFF_017482 [Zingiber officinale]|uniref:Integrase catalytic domain-containing protein n=1 Tax=Zingiber officinale TaxID=94328 RepID=A0A8J5HNS0_ZINOF|nr:hypothetical protein ZIOFF_017482 [Zingiber officinale]
MRTVFVSHELWDVIDEGYITHTPEEVAAFTNAQKKEHKENKTKDAKALSFMHQGVSRSILPRITSAKTAKKAWQILKNQFGGHEKVITIKLQNLWRDFDNLGMKDSENRKTARKRRITYRHKEHRKEEVVADFKILILVVKVEEEEVTLACDSRIKIQILIVAYAEEMVMTLKVVGIDAKVALQSMTDGDHKIWHLRYGHLSYKGLNLLKKKKMVFGLPNFPYQDKPCEGCIFGKMHRLPFPKISYRAKVPLELVHADICGPTQTPSLNNYKYFLLFVDDYTRMMWVYILNQKSEAFPKFLEFKRLVENQCGRKIKILRTDRGGEFIGNAFMDYCKEKGIQRQLTVRYSPQQNGVAERKNRTIVEMARSMMAGKGLPKSFWTEAVNAAVYILNRSPTKAVPNKTPYEAWLQRKPQVNNFKVLGCIAYSHIPFQQREKFDEKGEKLIFVGYSDQSKGYRLLDSRTNKLIISRDVIFDEMQSWNWGDKEKIVSQPTPPIFLPKMIDQSNTSEGASTSSNRDIYPESESPLDDGAAKVDAKIYRSLVGSLIYLTNTRPDIVYSVSLISRFMHEPSKLHYAAAKRILRYLQGTRKLGIKYVKEKENKLVGYTDSDWAGSLDDRKSTSVYIFCLGSKIISWVSKKQKTVSLSSAEAKYIAATDAACEAVWLRRILSDVEQK